MKRSTILLTVLILSACASSPPPAIPDWDIARVETQPVTLPAQLPLLCEIPWTDLACWQQIERYEVVSEANAVIATENASALTKTEQAYDALIEAGKAQQRYAALREEQLEYERRDHRADNWYHRAIIGLMLAGAVWASQ